MASRITADGNTSVNFAHINPGRNFEREVAVCWDSFAKSLSGTDVGIQTEMLKIERLYQYPNRDFFSPKASILFNKLNETFFPEFREWHFRSKEKTIFTLDYIRLQGTRGEYADIDLCSIWSKDTSGLFATLRDLGAFNGKTIPQTLPEIKAWLNDDANSGYLNQITILDLTQIGLKTLPKELFKLKSLKNLQLSSNLFITFPYDLSAWAQLETLNLSSNMLEGFSCDLTLCKQLKVLLLERNSLRTLSCDFSACTELRELGLHGNRFSEFSCDLRSCKKLEHLNFSTANIINFSLVLSSDVSLRRGPVSSIPLSHFSLPALDALIPCGVGFGNVLGICFDIPGSKSKNTIAFKMTASGWVGKIPLRHKFRFVCLNFSKHAHYIEKRESDRDVELINWRKEGPEVFNDVQF